MYIDKNLIDTIRRKIKISEIIGCFLDLKKRGQNISSFQKNEVPLGDFCGFKIERTAIKKY